MNYKSPDISDPTFCWTTLSDARTQVSSLSWNWLSDKGSLTERLKAKSRGDFAVELVDECWQDRLPTTVRKLFGPVSENHKFWSRKVNLVGQGIRWVEAHTLIPEHSLSGPLSDVLQLNSKPLGEYLFNHPQLIRSEIDVTPYSGDTWGRRSLFFLFGKPIMVAEFFLPSIYKNEN